jgi:uncharacterized protein (DUF1499 family)
MWFILYVVLGLALAAVLGAGLILVAHVEDWSRDLSTNVATTSDDSQDPRLRTIESKLPPGELADVVVAAVQELPRWELIEQSREPNVELHFVRTTGLMRFRDDVRVRIEPVGGGSRLSAVSRSRVGKGDLGQNPRNLRELLDKVRLRIQ